MCCQRPELLCSSVTAAFQNPRPLSTVERVIAQEFAELALIWHSPPLEMPGCTFV